MYINDGYPCGCNPAFQPLPPIPLCPAGPAGAREPAGVPGFGMARATGAQTLEVECGGIRIPLDEPSAGMLGVRAACGALTVCAAGRYWMDFYLNRLTCCETLSVSLRRNGLEAPSDRQTWHSPQKRSLHGQSYMELRPGDEIDLWLRACSPCVATLGSAGLTILRLQ